MVKFVSFVMAALLFLTPFAVRSAAEDGARYTEDRAYYSAILEKEIEYLEKLTLECGAVGMYPPAVSSYSGKTLPTVGGVSPAEYTKWPSARIVPYFSDTAVLGAIRADAAMGTESARQNALKYINWYISHMNTKESDICGVAGTVYDYVVFQSSDGRTVEVTEMEMYASQYPNGGNPHNYDSTDSYAAMFLQILCEYAKTYDESFLNGKAELVQTLTDVMMSDYINTLDLTVAKPDYPACYLMDNCEVYCGFVSAASIYEELLGDSAKAAECAERAEKVKNAILTRMWSQSDQCFLAAISDKGVSMFANDLNNFYPQASCQLFPLIFGVIGPDDDKAVITYERFKSDFGERWLTFDIETYPWCILVRAAVKMGDYEFAGRFIDAVNNRFVKRVHAAPYYNSESGSVMVAVAELYGIAEEGPAEESSVPGADDPDEGYDGDGPRSYLTMVCDGSAVPLITYSIPASLAGENSITVEALVYFGEESQGNVYLNLYPYKGTTLLRWTDYASAGKDALGEWITAGVTDWDPSKNGVFPDRYELGVGFYLATGSVSVAYIKVLSGGEVVWSVDFSHGLDLDSAYLIKHYNVTPDTEGEVWYITVRKSRLGDIDGNGEVTSDDAVYLLRHTLFADRYPVNCFADFDGNGETTSDDAVYLLRHTLFPAQYPLAEK